jgi:DNA polymerase III subunit delta'
MEDMRFSDVIEQEPIKDQLRRMAQSERLPHALLLLGPEGSGHLPLALAFAQYVLCEARGTEEACGQCPNCQKASRYVHPDLHFSFPTIGSSAVSDHFLPHWREALTQTPYHNTQQWLQRIGAENQQGNITKDECVAIVRKLSLKTFEAGRKILLMWMPEYLGKEGNRLLKLIEEPPEDTLFILVAENQELILNTILSRCQLLAVPPLADEAVSDGLLRRGIPAERAQAASQLANGNFNEALALTADMESDHAARFLDWLRLCYRGNGGAIVPWVETFASLGRENQKNFFRYGLHFFRELLALQLAGAERVRLRAPELETAQKLSAVLSYEKIRPIAGLFNDCIYFIERNANQKAMMLDSSIQLHRFMKQE